MQQRDVTARPAMPSGGRTNHSSIPVAWPDSPTPCPAHSFVSKGVTCR